MRHVAYAAPRQPRSLLGVVLGRAPSARKLAARVALAAREHLVTAAALVLVDVGAFHCPFGFGELAGLAMTGVSLLVLDFAVRG